MGRRREDKRSFDKTRPFAVNYKYFPFFLSLFRSELLKFAAQWVSNSPTKVRMLGPLLFKLKRRSQGKGALITLESQMIATRLRSEKEKKNRR